MEKLDLLAMLPCGLRNPFKDLLELHITSNESHYKSFTYLAEGNVNHELSFYPLLDMVESVDELPDIMISSDINNCFHRPFMDRFIMKGCFETYNPFTPNNYLQKVNFYDPYNNVTMLTANMLVMAVDTEKLGLRKLPETWEDILDQCFNKSITMRGDDEFFCNAVLLPFFKDHGLNAIKTMA
ncbi:MAG: ABC transporter substrate-binding protein, partial [Fibrobacter sp.]|nr:ABC transporter substrate-binding protein [Fibrobacter sp.]